MTATGSLSAAAALPAAPSTALRQNGYSASPAGASATIVSTSLPARPPASRSPSRPPALAQMKPTAYLINTARGEIVQTPALTAALQAGRLAGAGLDVTDPEPLPPDHPLCRMENVILAPHALAWTDEIALGNGALACQS